MTSFSDFDSFPSVDLIDEEFDGECEYIDANDLSFFIDEQPYNINS